MNVTELIKDGKTSLGIELGSTRIKSVLNDSAGNVLASGIYDWENSFVDGIWTYSIDEIHSGIRKCYSMLRESVESKYSVTIKKVGAIGISAMMHGYMAFDVNGNLLAPFQTWRNTNTQIAADKLTELFNFNIPLRWTIAHLYQRILDKEPHVDKLDFVCTLSSYIHYILTGEKVIGIGDASGMFPINFSTHNYDSNMIDEFNQLIKPYGYSWNVQELFPKVLIAGDYAGRLTESGALFLDETGNLEAGIPLCPPEGDAGTGMVATNSIAPGKGNVSAGTSIFAMIVLEKPLHSLYREIDIVTTPSGFPCAMSHANNGTSDINAWISIFGEYSNIMGIKASTSEIFEKLYNESLNGDNDCGGLLSYGYLSGENITMINEGRPIFARGENSRFTLANFMKTNLFTALGAIKIGIDILMKEEKVKVDCITGHGGFFKTKGVGQRYLSASLGVPVTVMNTAGEGGAWGMALLAGYSIWGKNKSLEEYLKYKIFDKVHGEKVMSSQNEIDGFKVFMDHYRSGLAIEKAAIQSMKW